MFSFRNCQEAVRRETTEASSIEFIGYRIPQYEQNGCRVLFTSINQQKRVGLFRLFRKRGVRSAESKKNLKKKFKSEFKKKLNM